MQKSLLGIKTKNCFFLMKRTRNLINLLEGNVREFLLKL